MTNIEKYSKIYYQVEKGSILNKNDKPIKNMSDIKNFVSLEHLPKRDYFNKLCTIKPDIENEKIEIENIKDEDNNRKGLVYLFVINGNVVKIGSTITTFKKRVQSYNCGKKSYRKNGTCSTTNYFTLQTFLNFYREDDNINIEVYSFFVPKIEADVFGVLKEIIIPPKDYEKTILVILREKDIFPEFCT